MNNISKRKTNVIAVLTVLVVSMFFTTNAKAETILESVNPGIIALSESEDLLNKNKEMQSSFSTSNVQGGGSLVKAENYMNRKLGDVVNLLQSFIKPFTYITFILSAISIVVGMLMGSKHKFAGILGMAFSILVYMCVSFGPEIVEYCAAWLSM